MVKEERGFENPVLLLEAGDLRVIGVRDVGIEAEPRETLHTGAWADGEE